MTVLDMSRALAGPACAQYLGDLGATVIKVESLDGDETRRWAPIVRGASPHFLAVNRGKRGLALDVKTDVGRKILDDLVRRSDVLVENFLPDVASRLGVTFERLHATNPRLVHVTIGGYGSTGPLANRGAYDLVLQAYTGMMSMTGEPGGRPMRSGPSAIDQAAGMLAFSGALAALLGRERSEGEGEHVEVSLLDAGIALLSNIIATYTVGGQLPRRSGSGLWHLVPYQVFDAADGEMLIGVTNDATWARFCEAIGRSELAEDERFATNTDRMERHDELIPIIAEILAGSSLQEWSERFVRLKIPFSPVNTLDKMLAEEQVRSRDAIIHVAGSDGKDLPLVSMPIKFASGAMVSTVRPPELGEHTDAILRSCGLDDETIRHLREDHVVR